MGTSGSVPPHTVVGIAEVDAVKPSGQTSLSASDAVKPGRDSLCFPQCFTPVLHFWLLSSGLTARLAKS